LGVFHKSKIFHLPINAIIGNPPYQVMDQGQGTGAGPIYHHFIDLAMAIAPQGTLIHPARCLFNAGKTPRAWNERILQDRHFRVIDYWPNSMDIFPSADVRGGIAISYWNRQMDFGEIGIFTPFDELRQILDRVKCTNPTPLSDIIAPRECYRLTPTLYEEHPDMEGRQSVGHKYSLGANVFEIFPELFHDAAPEGEMFARIYGRTNNQRCYKWCKRSYITHPSNFETYKVIIPKSNGSGTLGEVLSTPVVSYPFAGYTDTFLGIGQFATEREAIACLKYIKTKFARTLLSLLKATQDNPKDTWQNVPLQDFTSSSDIDWSLSVAEIDQQLYAKYHLAPEEIAFIEERVRPMV